MRQDVADTGSVGSANSDDVEVMETAFHTLLVDQRQVRVVFNSIFGHYQIWSVLSMSIKDVSIVVFVVFKVLVSVTAYCCFCHCVILMFYAEPLTSLFDPLSKRG